MAISSGAARWFNRADRVPHTQGKAEERADRNAREEAQAEEANQRRAATYRLQLSVSLVPGSAVSDQSDEPACRCRCEHKNEPVDISGEQQHQAKSDRRYRDADHESSDRCSCRFAPCGCERRVALLRRAIGTPGADRGLHQATRAYGFPALATSQVRFDIWMPGAISSVGIHHLFKGTVIERRCLPAHRGADTPTLPWKLYHDRV